MPLRVNKKRERERSYRRLNKHINFDLEGYKGNARKRPTEVTCVRCRKKVVLPFKPRNPEVYCDSCYKKNKKK